MFVLYYDDLIGSGCKGIYISQEVLLYEINMRKVLSFGRYNWYDTTFQSLTNKIVYFLILLGFKLNVNREKVVAFRNDGKLKGNGKWCM